MNDSACAACRHQRKKCEQNCLLAQYFPMEKNEDFQNVYWLFGVQNTLKILNSVAEGDRGKTAESLILEARIRRDNPVHGPIEVERGLQDQIEEVHKELLSVQRQIQFFKGS